MSTITFNREQRQALELLARGGARYGTRIEVMKELKAMGLCYAHDKGEQTKAPGTWGCKKYKHAGRWTWRPTTKGLEVIKALDVRNPIERHAKYDPETGTLTKGPTQ